MLRRRSQSRCSQKFAQKTLLGGRNFWIGARPASDRGGSAHRLRSGLRPRARTLAPPLVESADDDAAAAGGGAARRPLAAGDGRALTWIMVLGIVLMVVIFAQAIYCVVRETDYSGRFWCDVAGR